MFIGLQVEADLVPFYAAVLDQTNTTGADIATALNALIFQWNPSNFQTALSGLTVSGDLGLH